jgi:hypothetical protein
VRKLIVLLLVIAVLFVAANLLAAHLAGDEIATRAREATGAESASASVGTFPVLYRFVAEGTVPEVNVALSYVPISTLVVAEIHVSLHKVRIERAALLDQREVRIRSIASGTASVVVTAGELSAAVGRAVSLPGAGRIDVATAVGMVDATVALEAGDVLVVSAAGSTLLRVDLASSRLVPACDMSLEIEKGEVTASCSVSPVPTSVVQAISGAAGSANGLPTRVGWLAGA